MSDTFRSVLVDLSDFNFKAFQMKVNNLVLGKCATCVLTFVGVLLML